MNDRTTPGEWFVSVSRHATKHPELSTVTLLEVTDIPASCGGFCTTHIDCDVMSGDEEKDTAMIAAMQARADRHNAELCGGPSGPSERAPGYALRLTTETRHEF